MKGELPLFESLEAFYARLYPYTRQRKEIIHGTEVLFLDGSSDGEQWIILTVLQGAEVYATLVVEQQEEEDRQESTLQEENVQLRAIVQALVETDPYAYNDNSGRMECIFCNDTWGWSPHDKKTKNHEPDCLITQALALIRKP